MLDTQSLTEARPLPQTQMSVGDIEKRKKFVSLQSNDIARIATIRDVIVDRAAALSASFFEYRYRRGEASFVLENLEQQCGVKAIRSVLTCDEVVFRRGKRPFIKFWRVFQEMLSLVSWNMEKDFPRRRLASFRGQVRIHDGVLNVAVTKPILYKTKVGASVEKMRCNAMLEHMKMSFLRRDCRLEAVRFH